MSLKNWEQRVLGVPGAGARVDAIEAELRRTIAARDAAILAAARGADPDDFDELAPYVAGAPLDELD